MPEKVQNKSKRHPLKKLSTKNNLIKNNHNKSPLLRKQEKLLLIVLRKNLLKKFKNQLNKKMKKDNLKSSSWDYHTMPMTVTLDKYLKDAEIF